MNDRHEWVVIDKIFGCAVRALLIIGATKHQMMSS